MKIFDGLFHPSFDQETELLNLIKGLKNRYNVHGALAVPLPGQVNDINSYIASCSKFEFFKPVGLFDPHLKKVEEQVKNFKEARCFAIKIHPRFSCWDWTSSRGLKVFGDLIDKCEQYELPILFCTYFSTVKGHSLISDPLYLLGDLFSKFNKVKLVLLHGGCERILQYLEFFRYWDNVLIDISYTLTRYEGSSVDLDLSFAFKHLDRKVSFGSDSPYCDYDTLIAKLKKLADNADLEFNSEKMDNILYNNIKNFLNI